MSRLLNTEEALKLLKDCYITDSVQTLRKWIREGKIKARGSSYRQEGYSIAEEDLQDFIEKTKPGILKLLRVYYEVVDRTPIVPIIQRMTAGISGTEDPSWKEGEGLAELLAYEKDNESGLQHELQELNMECNEGNEIKPNDKILSNVKVKNSTNIPSNEIKIVTEMIESLQQQIEEINKALNKENKEQSENNQMDLKANNPDLILDLLQGIQRLQKQQFEELNKKVDFTVLEYRNNNKKASTVTNVRHKAKSEDEFIALFKKEWKKHSDIKLKGELKKEFEKKAKASYTFFYDETGLFKDESLQYNDGFKLTLKNDGEEKAVSAKDRKELMEQYFVTVLLPNIEGEMNGPHINNLTDKSEDDEDGETKEF